ncbi:MAG: heparin lyase I family protein, partial [Solirubrobacterales bacterium]
ALACAAFTALTGCGSGVAPPSPAFSGGFERGMLGFNLAGVGEVDPAIVEVPRGSHRHAAKFTLRGHQGRSELIVGGDGGEDNGGTKEFGEGAEGWLGFSVDILRMDYGPPRFFNLIMQFKGEGEGSPNFAMQLADRGGERGIWTSGNAMGHSRFLAPISSRRWHRVELNFRASNHRAGFYRLFLDGRLIDQRHGVSMIPPGRQRAYIKLGLYRDGLDLDRISSTLVDSVRIGRLRRDVAVTGR